MKKSTEIRSEIDQKVIELDNLVGLEERTLSTEEKGKFDTLKSEIDTLVADEKRAISLEEMRLASAENEKRRLDIANAAGGKGEDKEETKIKRSFSISNFIKEAGKGELTGINKEMHQDAVNEARGSGKVIEGYGIPSMIIGKSDKRTMNATTDTAGGYTVPTEVMTIVDYLYNKSVLRANGADFMTGLTGDISFPVRDNAITSGWLAETAGSDEKSPTFAQKAMSPKRLGSYIDLSKQLINQSNASIDSYITRELGQSILVDLENAAINGTGASNQPTGLLNTAGIGSVAMGTNGEEITWAAVVALVTEVAIDNADMGALNYITNAQVRGAMQTTEKASDTAQFILNEANSNLNGYGLGVTQHVPSNLTKGSSSGVCSALLFGNWNDLKIGQWGGLDILVDQYTQATAGTVRVVANGYFDVLALRPQSFAAIKDITTA